MRSLPNRDNLLITPVSKKIPLYWTLFASSNLLNLLINSVMKHLHCEKTFGGTELEDGVK